MTEKSKENLPSRKYSPYTSNEPRQWLMASINCRHADMHRLLGLDPKLVDWKNCVNGWTAMHYAAKFGSFRCTKLLIKYRANVNALSRDGQTPLHVAVLHAQPMMIKYLVQECGADTSLMDYSGRLPASFVDSRLSPDFYVLLTAGRVQRIRDALQLLRPSGVNPPRTNSTLKLLPGCDFKRPLLPSKSVLLRRHKDTGNGPHPSSRTEHPVHSSPPLSPPTAIGTADDLDSSGDRTLTNTTNGDVDHHRPANGVPAEAPPEGKSGRRSTWIHLLQATAAVATASAHHKASLRASLPRVLPSSFSSSSAKLVRSGSTVSACGTYPGRTVKDTSGGNNSGGWSRNMSLSSSSTTGYFPLSIPRQICPQSTSSIPPHLLQKPIPPDADLNLLSALLALLPPASEPESPLALMEKAKRSRHRFFSKSLFLDGSGDNEGVSGGGLQQSHRSPSCRSLTLPRGAGGVGAGKSLLRSLMQRRANSMPYKTSPVQARRGLANTSGWSSESQLHVDSRSTGVVTPPR